MMFEIDILLPTYNGAKHIKEQIDSLLQQTYTNWRLLIRDDCSSDSTVDIIRLYTAKYPKKIVLINNNGINLGSSLSFACLMQYSKANFVMLCDQDDVWLPNKIELSLNELKRMEIQFGETTPLAVFTDLTVVDDKLEILHDSFIQNQKLIVNAIKSPYGILAHNVVAGCTSMINRAAIECALPIPQINVVHDQWIMTHVAYYGTIRFINVQTILYRQHQANAVGAKKVNLKYMIDKFIFDNNVFLYLKIIDLLNFKMSKSVYLLNKIYYTIRRLSI